MNVRDIDLMTYREKTLHWTRPDAWNPDGSRLRFEQPKRPFRASTDQAGNIIHSPLLVGRPCLGIITAFVRYKDEMKPVKGRGMVPSSRCATCKVRETCERVVKERIKSFAPLHTAHDEWLRAEGPSKFRTADFERTHAGRLWKRIGDTAADAGFTSFNDEALIAHYQKLDRQKLQDDRRRKARSREIARKAGKIDLDHRADLEMAANNRLIDILEAFRDPRAPKTVRQLPIRSLQDMCEVWLGREVLRAEGRKRKAPDIARWIKANGYRNVSATPGALCTRVSKDLERIQRFERFIFNGAPLLTRFNPEEEYWSQIWLDVAAISPLECPGASERRTPLE